MIPVRFVVARSWDGLFVYDLDLLVEQLAGETVNRHAEGRRGDRRSDAPSSAVRQGL
jgi:hypothetical protein